MVAGHCQPLCPRRLMSRATLHQGKLLRPLLWESTSGMLDAACGIFAARLIRVEFCTCSPILNTLHSTASKSVIGRTSASLWCSGVHLLRVAGIRCRGLYFARQRVDALLQTQAQAVRVDKHPGAQGLSYHNDHQQHLEALQHSSQNWMFGMQKKKQKKNALVLASVAKSFCCSY